MARYFKATRDTAKQVQAVLEICNLEVSSMLKNQLRIACDSAIKPTDLSTGEYYVVF